MRGNERIFAELGIAKEWLGGNPGKNSRNLRVGCFDIIWGKIREIDLYGKSQRIQVEAIVKKNAVKAESVHLTLILYFHASIHLESTRGRGAKKGEGEKARKSKTKFRKCNQIHLAGGYHATSCQCKQQTCRTRPSTHSPPRPRTTGPAG